MFFWTNPSKNKILLTFGAGIFLFSTFVSALFPQIVQAQAALVIDTPAFAQRNAFRTEDKVELSVTEAITASVLSSAVQGARYFMTKIAYDTAQYVANGGKGQSALIFEEGWGQYLQNVGGDAVGAAVSELGSSWGLDFCKFPDINLQLYLQLGLRQMNAPTTDCTWNDLKATYGKDAWKKRYENVKNTADRFGTSDKILQEFSKAIKPANTDFGISVGALVQVDRIKEQKERAAELERTTGRGFKDLQSLISGNVMTPGQVISEETNKQLSSAEYKRSGEIQLAGIYASGAYQIIPETAAMFLNTLGSSLLQRLFNQGLVPSGGGSGLAYDYGSDPSVLNSVEEAKSAYNFLFARTPSQPTDYNIVAEFVSCPDNPGINNCVMDRGLQEALARSNIDQPLTIGEAIKLENGGYLNPNWPLISPRRLQENQNIKGCVSEKYCYSNIQKLRKARILPLGFEIAALRSDPDKPWTLGEVVAGFYDCHYDPNDPTKIIPDPAFPFCHLINPNWVIKAPQARCEIKVFADGLIDPASSIRREECADVSTCLGKDNTGACAQYGYCTKESNVWRIGGDACPAYYNTCTTYVNSENRKISSFLAKTLDYGECSADNKGCRAYSFVATGDPNATTSNWTNSLSLDVGQNQVIFFNEKIQDLSSVCNESNNGCSAFYGAFRLSNGRYIDANTTTPALDFVLNTANRLNIKKAPVYLGCYDGNKAQAGTQRPTTILEANVAASTAPACGKFASACVAEEVGCEAFTPINGLTGRTDGPTIPGKIGDGNLCAQACVGYETFKQEKTVFDSSKFPVYFIPRQAEECPASASGCSEFTNIDAQARGGEALEYYTDLKYCEKPLGDNVKTFYSWEGSANNGYVLLSYQLKPLTLADQNDINRPGLVAGSPAYILDTQEALDEFLSKCDEVKYNKLLANKDDPDAADPKCRAIFDSNGATYYRLIDKTVTVDPACHPLRKTEAVFELDARINNAQACAAKSGRWNDSGANPVCERCSNGGKFQNGFCVYQTISRIGESTSCQGPAGNPGQYNGCRPYSGNAAGNIEQIFLDDFEPGAENAQAFAQTLIDWSPNTLQVVGEATHIQFHSMQVAGGIRSAERKLYSFDLAKDGWYELSFLAKTNASSSALVAGFKADGNFVGQFASDADPIRLGNSWQLYTVGPIQFTGESVNTTTLAFERSGNNAVYFLDQVRLRKITDFKHYITDSWKKSPENNGFDVPLVCDSAPEDNLPGEALGCRQYNDSNNTPRYATGFQSLCREKAIGCEPVWDTFNTINGGDATLAQLFNVQCSANASQTCTVRYQGNELGNCFVAPGKNSCFVPQITLPANVTFEILKQANPQIALAPSTVVIPSDTPSTTPLFLALGEKQIHTCPEGAVGCRKVGQEQRILPTAASSSFVFNDVFVKNDPEIYKDTLCRNDLVGCSEYTHDNKVTYFKDPEVTGNSLCVYKPASDGISSQYGWFLKGIGKCTINPASQLTGDALCRNDNDCTGGNRCLGQETVACSADNLRVGGFFDIWSNKAAQYKGNVGVCNAESNTCSEIIDRQDTSNLNPEGKPYYILYNDKMEQKEKLCTQVSLSEGCVLFDKTDEPNKVFDSRATYLRSEKKPNQPFGPVEAVRSGEADFRVADSNKILKVERDRECSEWLACKSYASSVDYSGGARRETQICSQLAACDQIGVGGTCANWVDPRRPGDAQAIALSRLTYDKYVTRGVSWYNTEFAGYSLYNKYQIGDMVYVKFSFPEEFQDLMENEMNQTYIVRQLRQSIIDNVDANAFDCKPDNANENTDWQTCGFGDNQVNGGRCYSNQCLYPINGSFPTNVVINVEGLAEADRPEMALRLKNLISFIEPNSCKGAPEPDSPYSDKILKVGVGDEILSNGDVPGERRNTTFKLEGFSGANACQFGACSCAYQKVQYKNGQTDYWPLLGLKQGTVIPEGVCSGGGQKDAHPCTQSIDCVDNNDTVTTEDDEFGTCGVRQNVETRIGLEGYCLEDDLSRPIFYNGQNSFACLTWLPVNISASSVDIYNRDVSAGYNLQDDANKGGGEIFCSVSTQSGAGVYDPNWMTLRTAIGNTIEEQMEVIYNENFNNLGQPKLAGYALYTCGDALNLGDLSPYMVNICASLRANQEAPAKVVSNALYSWLYKQKLTNATLLRFEWGSTDNTNNWGNDFDGNEAHTDRRIYSFAPLNAGVDPDEKIKEFGTIMHMPRTFSNQALSENNTWLTQGDIINPPENVAEDHDAKVHTGAYGVVHESAIRNNRGVYRSDFERYLRENDLAKIHFLPLSYPGGANSEVPTLMEKAYAIDFDRLRTPGMRAADAVLLLDSNNNNANFALPKAERDTILWTYKVENISQSAFAFNDYSKFAQTNAVQNLTSGEIGERNRIHTRYVAVWADWIAANAQDATPNFLQQHVPIDFSEGISGILRDQVSPADPNSDPFAAPCVSAHDNWLAIGMDFNKDGEFLGYISRWCNYGGGGRDDIGIQFAVAAVLHDRCATFDQVYQTENIGGILSGTTNKAWTNKVWSGATASPNGPRKLDNNRPWSLFLRDTPHAPFGSLQMTEYELANQAKLRNYTFRTKQDGLPYVCSVFWNGGLPYGSSNRCNAMLLIPLIDPTFVADMNTINIAASSGKIDSIFAAIWQSITVSSTIISGGDNQVAISSRDTGINHVFPPKIYSLNPARCENRDKCNAAEEANMTISGRNGTLTDYNGDNVPDEPDSDGNGAADPIIAPGGTYTAEAKFFAFADDNHMPLRRVMVDWDEEGLAPVNEDKRGLYKNRKPLCSTSNNGGLADISICADRNNTPTGITCSIDKPCPGELLCIDGTSPSPIAGVNLRGGRLGEDYKTARFGNTPRACVEDYFIFVHQYSCGPSNVGTKNAVFVRDLTNAQNNPYSAGITPAFVNGLKGTYGLADDDYVCVFKPRVQVQDNWGWCNGQCTRDYNGILPNPNGVTENGCYSKFPLPENQYSDQCANSKNPVESVNPWSSYRGSIIVIPDEI